MTASSSVCAFSRAAQSETARVLGTTQVQISRRERRILKWMREQLLEPNDSPDKHPLTPSTHNLCRQPAV
ncbi:MAG: hypothetical protein ACLVFR_13270, partial [Gemmiger formicilis]